ncbi:DUF5050 domain-containing protein [Cytobacillus sp. FJAT-54145]|uniref:DUF5050 domain-containing protein n=1 Tax=Cytobacillus spartinae TaxID=3299023 RepID=A0ABW6KDY3_9BACI
MKKFKIIILSFALLISLFMYSTPSSANSECAGVKVGTKIWWDGVELKPGQIGRLFVLKDTPLYKLDGDKKVTERTLKAGEKYRIYAFKPGMLSLGGGLFIDRDSRVKYETPSKAKLKLVACANPKTPTVPTENIFDYDGVVYYLNTEYAADYYIYNKATNKSSFITDSEAYIPAIQIGNWVYLLIYDEENNINLYRVTADGTKKERLTSDGISNFTSDGKYIYFLGNYFYEDVDGLFIEEDYVDIYRMDLDGKNTKQIGQIDISDTNLYANGFAYANGHFYISTNIDEVYDEEGNYYSHYKIEKVSMDGTRSVVYEQGPVESGYFDVYVKNNKIYTLFFDRSEQSELQVFNPVTEDAQWFYIENGFEVGDYTLVGNDLYYSGNSYEVDGRFVYRLSGDTMEEIYELKGDEFVIHYGKTSMIIVRNGKPVKVNY